MSTCISQNTIKHSPGALKDWSVYEIYDMTKPGRLKNKRFKDKRKAGILNAGGYV